MGEAPAENMIVVDDRNLVSIDDGGIATAFLAHDAARLLTGETLYIDGGYHIIE
jgi:enoyl-[acyl-carrier protein] reductase I